MKLLSRIVPSLLIPAQLCLGAAYYPSESAEVDRAREAVKSSPTTPENYQQRMLMFSLWLHIAQQQSADTHSLFDSDKAYYTAEQRLVSAKGGKREKLLKEICLAVDANYHDMETVFQKLKDEGPIFKPFKGDLPDVPVAGNMDRLAHVSER